MSISDPILCEKCGHERSDNLSKVCPHCGARKTFFGYKYEHENRDCLTASIIVAVVVIVLIMFGALLLAWFASGMTV